MCSPRHLSTPNNERTCDHSNGDDLTHAQNLASPLGQPHQLRSGRLGHVLPSSGLKRRPRPDIKESSNDTLDKDLHRPWSKEAMS